MDFQYLGEPNDQILSQAASAPAKPEGHMPPPADSNFLLEPTWV
jgi:hypothetical protein